MESNMRKTFVVTIEIVDDMPEVYPNYRWNYDRPEDFIRAREDFIRGRIEEIAEPAANFGYTITYKEIDC